MHRIDHPTAVAALPAPGAPGTPGYFTEGDPVGGVPATVVTQAWANAIQEELIAILAAASIDPDKTVNNQVLLAIQAMIAAAAIGSYWAAQPIGVAFPILQNAPLPPKSDPNFRYVLLTAGQSGAGQYNEGVLINETVTGSAPRLTATAQVNLSGSPINGVTLNLINSERRFVGAGESQIVENDMFQGHWHELYKSDTSGLSWQSGTFLPRESTSGAGDLPFNPKFVRSAISDGVNGSPITGNRTQPYTLRLAHYMRIF